MAVEVAEAPPDGEEDANAVGALVGHRAPGVLGAPNVAPGAIAGDGEVGAEFGDESIERRAGDALVFRHEVVPVEEEGLVGTDARRRAGGDLEGVCGDEAAPPLPGVFRRAAVDALEGEAALDATRVLGGQPLGHGGALGGGGGKEGLADLAPQPHLLHLAGRQMRHQQAQVFTGDKSVHGVWLIS